MINQNDQPKKKLLAEIGNSWVMLNSFLANLTRAQKTTLRDAHDWSVKDHITHITAWEESVVFFLEGKPRYEALGIGQSDYEELSIDEINTLVRNHRRRLFLPEATAQFQAVHRRLLSLLAKLSDEDLEKPLESFNPETKDGEERLVIDLIRDNTAGHFSEHLAWIEELVSRQQ
jgi:hypothetical protein